MKIGKDDNGENLYGFPKATTSRKKDTNIITGMTFYIGNSIYDNGYDIISLIAHEIGHIVDIRNGRSTSETSADLYSMQHWSYSKTSERRKEDIKNHMK